MKSGMVTEQTCRLDANGPDWISLSFQVSSDKVAQSYVRAVVQCSLLPSALGLCCSQQPPTSSAKRPEASRRTCTSANLGNSSRLWRRKLLGPCPAAPQQAAKPGKQTLVRSVDTLHLSFGRLSVQAVNLLSKRWRLSSRPDGQIFISAQPTRQKPCAPQVRHTANAHISDKRHIGMRHSLVTLI